MNAIPSRAAVVEESGADKGVDVYLNCKSFPR